MAKFVCKVCGYIHEGDSAPERCPQCRVPAEKFEEVVEKKLSWATEHVVGITDGVSEDIINDLRANFNGECMEVGMYLAMSRVAFREGYPEIGLYWEKAALEEAEHAAKFAEILGEVVTPSTKKNLELRVAAENGATEGKFDLAKRAKQQTLTRSTTPFTKWQRTKQDTAELSKVFSTDISVNKSNESEVIPHEIRLPLRLRL